MNNTVIASLKIKTDFYHEITKRIEIISLSTAIIPFILTFVLLMSSVGEIKMALLISAIFTVVTFFITYFAFKEVELYKCDKSNITFYSDKFVVNKHYLIEENPDVLIGRRAKYLLDKLNYENQESEYRYEEIDQIMVCHSLKEKKEGGNLNKQIIIFNIIIGKKIESIEFLIENIHTIVDIQQVLGYLYEKQLDISESTSENKRTYLLYYNKEKTNLKHQVGKEMLALIEEIGKEKQAE